MNRDQRVAVVAALAVALWGLGQAIVPFDVEVAFGLSGGCSSPLIALSDDEPVSENPFVGEVPDDELQTCADVAGRRLITGLVTVALAAAGGYAAFRILAGREAEEGPAPPDESPEHRIIPLEDELPPYAG